MHETRPNTTGFLFCVRWLLSFFWPQKIARSKPGEEYLELILYRGRKLVDSKNANYSYGNLQTAYIGLFRQLDIDWTACNDVLVLGFGVGGVSSLMQQKNPSLRQIGVEYNSQMIEWYTDFFVQINQLQLVHEDAHEYVKSCEMFFDVIVVDLFTDLSVEPRFQSSEFLALVKKCLTANGVLIYNKVSKSSEQNLEYQSLVLTCSSLFRRVKVIEQMDINKFIICRK